MTEEEILAVASTSEEPTETVETVGQEDRLFMTTHFDDYTVTEGLLLLIFVLLVIQFFWNLVRRWF